VHLDRRLIVPPRLMRKPINVEVGPKLTIDAGEEIEIEGCGHAVAIIIRGDQRFDVLTKIDPDDGPE
jgi:hypothetical protein